MHHESIRFLVLSTAGLFIFITAFISYFVILYRNKQVLNIREQEKLQAVFRQEILKTQIEVQEQTLSYMSKEMHDNIAQVLSFIKLSLAMVSGIDEKQKQARINECRELLTQVITDVRDLSKSISFEHIVKFGLAKTIEIETERISKTGALQTGLMVTGDPYPLGEQQELVLFRIFQEALNNTLKHAGAKNLKVVLHYAPEMFNLSLEDDGTGFTAIGNSGMTGSGLKNIENRAALIGATAIINSLPGNGCCIRINLDTNKQFIQVNGSYPNSIS